jgi:hypothetical protein
MSNTSTVDHMVTSSTGVQQANGQKDFWLLYPSATGNGSVAGALHALYYLPSNYKLMVLSNALSRDFMSKAEGSISDRVHFETGAGLSSGTSPFSYAGAIIYDGADAEATDAKTPTVIVSQQASQAIESDNHSGFTVSADNPEALATAILRISRATA